MLLADKTACPAQDCFLFRLKRKAFMKAGIVDSLQLWVYKLKDGVKQGASSRLRVSVAMIKRHNLLSTNVEERQDLLISMTHQGEAGWLGEILFSNASSYVETCWSREAIPPPPTPLFGKLCKSAPSNSKNPCSIMVLLSKFSM